MYHISLYFDKKTTMYMQELIGKVAHATGNKYMLEANVPPHITLCALNCAEEETLVARLECVFGEVKSGGVKFAGEKGADLLLGGVRTGTLQWVSVGSFLPGVIFLQPVLNEYLQDMIEQVHRCVLMSMEQVSNLSGVKISPCYKPFSWLPHSTIAKKLTPGELQLAFEILQKEFVVFEGQVARVGLAKMNPHREIASWELP